MLLIAGHGRFEAAQSLGRESIPAIVVEGLSEAKKRALMLADNRIAQSAGWDRERLSIELAELPELLIQEGIEIGITGFEPAEIDLLHLDFEDGTSDPAEDISDDCLRGPRVTQTGDLWCLGKHRLLCGDARSPSDLARLVGGERAHMAFLDPPYNVAVRTIVGRTGQEKHPEFAMASGEMSRDEFIAFLKATLNAAAKISTDGAVHFVCIDWRHVEELVVAGRSIYGAMLNLITWVKTNAGQGSFYRSQHELIGVFRVGTLPPPEHGGTGSPRPQPFQRLALCRGKYLQGRSDGRLAGSSNGQADRPDRRRHQGLHASQSDRPRYFLRIGFDAFGGGADGTPLLRS